MWSTKLAGPQFVEYFISILIILRKEIRHIFILKTIYKENTILFSGSNVALEIFCMEHFH